MRLDLLSRFLDSKNYSILVKSLIGSDFYLKPWKAIPEYQMNKLMDDEKDFVNLFFCGEEIENINNIIEKQILIDEMFKLGLLSYINGKYSLNNYRIIPYMGLYIITEARKETMDGDFVWFGEDSLYLANILPANLKGNALDLCTGSGIQALILGSRGMKVKAVDINIKAVKIAKFNVSLNGLDDRVIIEESNLFEAVKNDKFDLIVANPPFLAVERKEVNHFFANAGSDGLDITREIINDCDSFLNENGKLIMIAGGFGSDGKLNYAEEILAISKAKDWNSTFVIIGKDDSEKEMARLGKLLPDLKDELLKFKSEENTKFYYSFILIVDKCYGAGKQKIINTSQSTLEYMKELRRKKSKMVNE